MSEELICYVDSIIYEASNICVFKAITENERLIQVVIKNKKIDTPIKKGESYKVYGYEIISERYGAQLLAEDFFCSKPTSKILVSFLIYSPFFRGIGLGKKKVLKLSDNYKGELLTILNNGDWKRLVSDYGLSLIAEPIAKNLVEIWKEYSDITEVISFIVQFGLTGSVASIIQKRYKKDSIEIIKDDPYKLIAFLEPGRKSWNIVEGAAKKLGVIDKNDKRRLLGAAEMSIYLCHDRGDTVISRECIEKDISKFIGFELSAVAVDVALSKNLLIMHDGNIQHKGIAKLEERVGNKLYSMLGANINGQQSLFYSPISDDDIKGYFVDHNNKSKWTFNEDQKQAIKNAFNSHISVIVGGAGVGKTSAIKAIGDIATNNSRGFYQVALAGRAAKRMQEATGYKARTIASFVKSAIEGNVILQEGDFLVIDEASMVSLSDISKLLRIIINNIHVVFVGDDFQLPPVSFGEVFSVLSNDENVCKTTLTEVYRQDDKTGIPSIASTIRSCKAPSLKTYKAFDDGVSFIECVPEKISDTLCDVYHDLTQQDDDVQILSMTNTGIGGVKGVNSTIQNLVFSKYETDAELFVGDKIIYLVNDYDKELYNGSLGVIQAIKQTLDGSVLSVLWDDDVVRDIYLQTYNTNFQLAYSITVHKAQGSQFDRVIIPIRKGRNLDNRMLYTALTRSVKQVVFVGSWAAFRAAVVADPRTYTRCVGLKIKPSASLKNTYKIAS